ncbi:helix-turn-helix domain-containing protein [Halorubrum sp. AD140]|uniref:helix-turn-helix domain-containing protein n=1 Tax=Halorubrum sp. AD140 TaxID=3050073 RepID=UPI002ACCC568|nr:helix-turn-helix domain-containing protein [Halorubrum sp. AD140]MDZ5810201.1 helix-turn-helix domain-containing protein [Halorubrum sp. AD140]
MRARDSVAERNSPAETTLAPLPEQLDSHVAKLLYLYLYAVGPATPAELSAALQMQKLTVYPVLRQLKSRDLVSRNGQTYRV